MKRLTPIIFSILFLFSACSDKEEPPQEQPVDQASEIQEEAVQTEEISQESQNQTTSLFPNEKQSYPGSMDPKWFDEAYQVPPWGGTDDVTQLPEYIYTKLYWQTTGENWPSIEELLSKYNLQYDEINAVNLNYAGLEVYKQKEYLDAIALFRWGTLLDPSYTYTHFNLACSASLLLDEILQGKPEDFNHDLYRNKYGYYWAVPFLMIDEIFNHLALTIFLEKDYLTKMQRDEDLTILHSMRRYKSFVQFAESGDLWPYYGFFSGQYESDRLDDYSISLDGRCLRDLCTSDFRRAGSIMCDTHLSYPALHDLKETTYSEEITKTFNLNDSLAMDTYRNNKVHLWKAVVYEGYIPAWDSDYDLNWDSYNYTDVDLACNLRWSYYFTSVGTSLMFEGISGKRIQDELGWPLEGFVLMFMSAPLPQEIDASHLVFSRGKELQRTDAVHFWNALHDNE